MLSSDPGASSRVRQGSTVVVKASPSRASSPDPRRNRLDARKAFEAEGLANVEVQARQVQRNRGHGAFQCRPSGCAGEGERSVKVQVAQSFTVRM